MNCSPSWRSPGAVKMTITKVRSHPRCSTRRFLASIGSPPFRPRCASPPRPSGCVTRRSRSAGLWLAIRSARGSVRSARVSFVRRSRPIPRPGSSRDLPDSRAGSAADRTARAIGSTSGRGDRIGCPEPTRDDLRRAPLGRRLPHSRKFCVTSDRRRVKYSRGEGYSIHRAQLLGVEMRRREHGGTNGDSAQ